MYVFLKLSSRSRHVFLPVRENLSSDVSKADEPHAENAMGRGVPVILPGGDYGSGNENGIQRHTEISVR